MSPKRCPREKPESSTPAFRRRFGPSPPSTPRRSAPAEAPEPLADAPSCARLWLPLDKIVHENAIIGEIKDGDNYYVRVIARDSELDGDPGAATEGKLNYEKRNKICILS